jgi:Fic family protein
MPLGGSFEKRIERLPSGVWTKIARIDELKGKWSAGANLSPQILDRLQRSVLVTSTGASTRIEGAKLSDGDIEKLMRGISIRKFAGRDQQEVSGYFELLRNVFDAWQTMRLSEGTIQHLHQELLKYVDKDKLHRGRYKKKENKVLIIDAAGRSVGTLFDTTPAYLTPKQMLELVEWTVEALGKKTFHPLPVIGNFIVEFLKIHPFEDGNGRLSRILTNLLLLKEGYLFMPYVSHEKLIEDNKPDYYLALRQSQKTFKTGREDIAAWMDFFLTVVLRQGGTAVGLLAEGGAEKDLSPKQQAVWEYLQTVEEATPGGIARKTKVARPTVNQVLEKLMRLKKVARIGLGRTTRYRRL